MKSHLLMTACGVLCLAFLLQNGALSNDEPQMKVHIQIGSDVITATLLDTQTSRDFVSLLPLKLKLTDYARAEKISDLPRKLSEDKAPSGYTPSEGDLAYYAPWGNVALFYKNSGYANRLIKLGRIDSGIEKIASIKGDFDAVFEAEKQR